MTPSRQPTLYVLVSVIDNHYDTIELTRNHGYSWIWNRGEREISKEAIFCELIEFRSDFHCRLLPFLG